MWSCAHSSGDFPRDAKRKEQPTKTQKRILLVLGALTILTAVTFGLQRGAAEESPWDNPAPAAIALAAVCYAQLWLVALLAGAAHDGLWRLLACTPRTPREREGLWLLAGLLLVGGYGGYCELLSRSVAPWLDIIIVGWLGYVFRGLVYKSPSTPLTGAGSVRASK